MLSITVRRTLTLLNQLGAVQSINGVGSKILSTEDSLKKLRHDPAHDKKTAAGFPPPPPPAQAIGLWKDRLAYIRENFRYESVVFASLEIIPVMLSEPGHTGNL